jgi:hypothetical protein
MICIALHLRRTRHGPGREGGAQEVEVRDPRAQVAGDLRDEVRHVREPLRLEEALDVDRAGHAHPRQVVAGQVDEHDVLGSILLGGGKSRDVAVAGGRRPRDRVGARAAAFRLDERLG